MKIKQELTCKFCSQIYNNPITLSCGDTVCRHHIDEQISNKFMCPLCNEENTLQNIKVNKLIENLLRFELHEFKINPIYERVLNYFKKEIGNLEAILNDPERYVFEEINELKRLVDLDREKLNIQIDEIANEFIQRLEYCENVFRTECKTKMDLEHFNELLESSRKKLAEYEQCLSLFSTKNEDRYERRTESEKKILQLRAEIKELKEKLLSSLTISYEIAHVKKENLFGKLSIKVSFYLNSS